MNEHYMKLTYFLLWLEYDKPNEIYGSYTVSEVIDSLAAIMDVEKEKLRNLI